jgi:hypothetical protein
MRRGESAAAPIHVSALGKICSAGFDLRAMEAPPRLGHGARRTGVRRRNSPGDSFCPERPAGARAKGGNLGRAILPVLRRFVKNGIYCADNVPLVRTRIAGFCQAAFCVLFSGEQRKR